VAYPARVTRIRYPRRQFTVTRGQARGLPRAGLISENEDAGTVVRNDHGMPAQIRRPPCTRRRPPDYRVDHWPV